MPSVGRSVLFLFFINFVKAAIFTDCIKIRLTLNPLGPGTPGNPGEPGLPTRPGAPGKP